MNRLDDLKQTLDSHAAGTGSPALDHASRSSALDGRIAAYGRRRTAVRGGVAGVAALAVAAAVLVPQLDDATGKRGIAPVDREVLGMKAPAVIQAADGWTYRFADAVESDRSKVELTLPESRFPRLVTWATDGGGQAVDISGAGLDWTSQKPDFADYVVAPQGDEGAVVATAAPGGDGVALAVYEIDLTRPPAGVGDPAGIFFRDASASHRQLGAAVGEPGDTEITVPWSGAGAVVANEPVCADAPEGAAFMVSLSGAEVPAGMTTDEAAREDLIDVFGSCDDAGLRFDPGAAPGYSVELADADLPASGTARMWLSVSEDDPTPLDPATAPDVRLGLGIYSPAGDGHTVMGFRQNAEIEQLGHRWSLATVDTVEPVTVGATVDVSQYTDDGPALVSFVQNVRGDAVVTLMLETTGVRDLQRTTFGVEGAGESQFGSELLLPGTTGIRLELMDGDAADILDQRMVVYTLVD